MFLIRNVTPAVATSYAYVNPVVAVLLGTGFGGESLSLIEWLALAVIIFAVVLVTLGKYLFPRHAARLLLVRRRSSRRSAGSLRIDLRVPCPAPQIHFFQTLR